MKKILLKIMIMAMIVLSFNTSFAQTFGTIGAGVTVNTNFGDPTPLQDYWKNQRMQLIYTQAELLGAGLVAGSVISEIGWDATALNGSGLQENYTISMQNTATALFATTTFIAGGWAVVKTPLNYTPVLPIGWKMFTLTTPFAWNGTGSLAIQLCAGLTTGAYTTNVSCRNTSLGVNNFRCLYARSDATFHCPSLTGTRTIIRPNIRIGFSAPSVCNLVSGAVTAANGITGTTSLCQGAALNLTMNTAPTGSGLSYQWESDPGCINAWGNISSATNSTYSTTQGATPTCYRCLITCSSSGFTANSTAVTVNINPFYFCYTPASATSTIDEDISNVTLGTLNNSSAPNVVAPGAGSVASLYSNWTGVAPPTIAHGLNYSYSISMQDAEGGAVGFYPTYACAWIDYNLDGDFLDGNEQLFLPGSNNGNGNPFTLIQPGPSTVMKNGVITVPITAGVGLTGFRIRISESLTFAGQPNTSPAFDYGEVEDYLVNILAALPCVGNATGTVTALPALVCPQTNITLASTGMSTGAGIQYQWQFENGGGWTDLAGATNIPYNFSGQLITTQYRLGVRCGVGAWAYSTGGNAPTVTNDIGINCYCTPTVTNVGNSGDFVANVTVTPSSLNNTSTVAAPNYILYPAAGATTGTFDLGSIYQISLTNGGWAQERVGVWVDYNQDGVFGVSEWIGQYDYIAGGQVMAPAFTWNVPAPGFATTGLTRMRVKCWDFSAGFGNPAITGSGVSCSAVNYGECEDYQITLQNLPPCTGVAGGGVITSTDPTPCAGITFTLGVPAGGTTSGVNSGYQFTWERSTVGVGGPYLPIAAGNGGPTWTGTQGLGTNWYRRKVKCTLSNIPFGDSAYNSTPLALTGTFCWCAASFTTGTGNGTYVSNMEIENTGLNNASLGAGGSPAYTNYIGTVTTPNLMQNAPYWFKVTTGSGLQNQQVGIWIDYNQNGLLTDLGEFIATGALPGNNTLGVLLSTIPAGAALGTTLMRVRISSTIVTLDPCLSTAPNYVNGETEDYAVNIVPLSCIGATIPGSITSALPNITATNDAVQVVLDNTGSNGTLINWQICANPAFTGTVQTYIGYFGNLWINLNRSLVYARANYQSGGCPVVSTNNQLFKLSRAPGFTTGAQSNDFIDSVVIRNATNTADLLNYTTQQVHTTGADSYENNMDNLAPINLQEGTTYNMAVSVNEAWTERVIVWLDRNGDDSLDAAASLLGNGELLYNSGALDLKNHNFSFTVACGDYVGLARLRVMCNDVSVFNNNPIHDPTTTGLNAYTWGNHEDYLVYLDPSPELVVNPSSAVCIGQTAVLAGVAPVGTTNWQWTPTTGVNGVIMNPANGAAATVTVSTTTPSDVFFTVTGTLANGCTSYNVVPVATTPLAGVVSPAGSVICSGGVKFLTATGAAGTYQWQISSDNITWADISGATNGLSYTTAAAIVNKYYRLLSKSAICYDISSNTAFVEIATTPVVTFSNVTATSATVNWTPTGGGNYQISWSGAGTGLTASVTPPVSLSGLTPNTNLNVTVTQTSPGACVPAISSGTANTKTLCAAPLAPSFGAITTTTVVVNIPVGATSYKVFYKLMTISNTYLSSGVLAGGSSYTILSSIGTALYPGVALSVYLQAFNCPTVGLSGQAGPVVIQYLLPGTSSCPTPAFTLLSDCSNRIKVTLSGNPTNAYRVTFRRLSPSVNAPNSYNFTGTTLNYTVLNTPLPQIWEVYAQSTCGSAYGLPRSTMTQIQQILVKSGCNKINNLVLSHVTCNGFTATWNVGDCGIAPGLTGYTVFTKEGASQWNGYSNMTNVRTGSIWNSGATILCYVRANSCNGSFGPASDIQTITLLSGPGCREEDQQTEENLFGKGVTNEFGTLSLFPNPNSGLFNMDLQISNMTAQDVRVEVVNMLGQAVLTQITSINDGHLTESVDLPENITSGSYMVRVIVGDKAIFNSQVNISK